MDVFTEANKTEIAVYDALKTVIDPELGVNIIDLGFVYKIQVNETNELLVEMTLSSKGCPMGDVITEQVEAVIKDKFPGIKLNLVLVWEPKWSTDNVTPEGKIKLGFN